MKRSTVSVLSFCMLYFLATAKAQSKHLVVDVSHVMNKIPHELYGSCIEDVNHEIYGGLYAQRIFGESFEEPERSAGIRGWVGYGGRWTVKAGVLEVGSGPGDKLVSGSVFPEQYSSWVSLKFGKTRTNAGILVNVQDPGVGPDRFAGYEISLDPNRQMLILGKHRQDWEPVREIPVHFNPADWTLLRVDVRSSQISVFVGQGAKPVLVYRDSSQPVTAGRFAFRTYDATVSFKDFGYDFGAGPVRPAFTLLPSVAVSGMWDPVDAGNGGKFTLDSSDACNGRQSQTIINTVEGQQTGIANSGLNRWGIAFQKDHAYEGSLFLKSTGPAVPVTVALQNARGTRTYASATLTGLDRQWKRFRFSLRSDGTDTAGRFAILLSGKGGIKVDQVTLMPAAKDQPFKGLPLRADIGSMMQAEGLNFLRYGGTMVNASGYRWKKMIGPKDKRPPYKGHWYPYSTNGFGIEDFLQFCEAAGFEPAFAINIEETPQDVRDMVDYLKADTTTFWGKQRAENGHPQPYKVKYIEIGNEEVIANGDIAAEYTHYIDRFKQLYQAIHSRDSSIQLIISAWWRPASENMKRVFQALDGKASYWDLHVDADAPNGGTKVDSALTQMQALFRQWNPKSQLKCTIFEENGNHHDLARALGHATILNAVRKHGDFVLTSCAANALQPSGENDNGWDQGQIFFTPSKVWGMPPYYAQKMAAAAHLPLRVWSSADAGLDVSATRSKDGKRLILHVINTHPASVTTRLQLDHFAGRQDPFTAKVLTGALTDKNSVGQPQKITPQQQTLSWEKCAGKYTFRPYSYTLLEFNQ